ncbi:uncharacterized protein AMSG_05939 [Thecamonas trahens ATCC 50062]|uniref:Uncharacterized protein n=1 Tax=Thecamonas trahens ATCC 50062 TaxID=461836 RepID=A0A0L0DBG4_THETB|nr:hypothetical protein AMSG_05939 [Thecamonas trahens ATCC 50062]KNC49677.1 hypothetical protein AMSG_05939 [Thecamonas trahens ATCC 50062]|eukprot:XP_013757474.1 hypothetical protein AMSG_05939 [Thecamonas trahens ATCC 50062]
MECPTCGKYIPSSSQVLHSVHCARRAFGLVPGESGTSEQVAAASSAASGALDALVAHEPVCGARTDVCLACGNYVRLFEWDAHQREHAAESGENDEHDGAGEALAEVEAEAAAPIALHAGDEAELRLAVVDTVLDAVGIDLNQVSDECRTVLSGLSSGGKAEVAAAKAFVVDSLSVRIRVNPFAGFADTGTFAVQLAMWIRYSTQAALTRGARSLLAMLLDSLPARSEVSHINAPGLVSFPSTIVHVLLDVVLPLLLDRTFELAGAPARFRQASFMAPAAEPEIEPADAAAATARKIAAAVAAAHRPQWLARLALVSLQNQVLVLEHARDSSSPALDPVVASLVTGHKAAIESAVEDLELVARSLVPLLGPHHVPGSRLCVASLVASLGYACAMPSLPLGVALSEVLAHVLAAYPSFAAQYMSQWLEALAEHNDVCQSLQGSLSLSSLTGAYQVQRVLSSVRLAARMVWLNPHMLRTRAHLMHMVRTAEAAVAALAMAAEREPALGLWRDEAVGAFDGLMRGVPLFLYAKDVPYLSGCGEMAAILELSSPAAQAVVAKRILTVVGATSDDGPRYGSLHTSLVVLHLMVRLMGLDDHPPELESKYLEFALWATGLVCTQLHEAPPVWMSAASPLIHSVLGSIFVHPAFTLRLSGAEASFMAEVLGGQPPPLAALADALPATELPAGNDG